MTYLITINDLFDSVNILLPPQVLVEKWIHAHLERLQYIVNTYYLCLRVHYLLSHIHPCRRKFHSSYNCHMTQAAETEIIISDTCPELTSSSVAAAAVFLELLN